VRRPCWSDAATTKVAAVVPKRMAGLKPARAAWREEAQAAEAEVA
jgi:hypothetical protein